MIGNLVKVILVFIHRSIKTRIETIEYFITIRYFFQVFIHRSIKTRIETRQKTRKENKEIMFLYIDPLKQGLKLLILFWARIVTEWFLYIDPLKQGLKL